MGNSHYRKLFFPGDLVETKYKSLHEINVTDLDRNEINLFCVLICRPQILILKDKSINQIVSSENLIHSLILSLGDKIEILGFPCNQFNNEPGNYETIRQFYHNTMNINFKLFGKIEVNGQFSSPLYKYLKKNSNLFNLQLVNSNPIPEDFCKQVFGEQIRESFEILQQRHII